MNVLKIVIFVYLYNIDLSQKHKKQNIFHRPDGTLCYVIENISELRLTGSLSPAALTVKFLTKRFISEYDPNLGEFPSFYCCHQGCNQTLRGSKVKD